MGGELLGAGLLRGDGGQGGGGDGAGLHPRAATIAARLTVGTFRLYILLEAAHLSAQ